METQKELAAKDQKLVQVLGQAIMGLNKGSAIVDSHNVVINLVNIHNIDKYEKIFEHLVFNQKWEWSDLKQTFMIDNNNDNDIEIDNNNDNDNENNDNNALLNDDDIQDVQ